VRQNDIVVTRDMSDVGSELGNEVKTIELSRLTFVMFRSEGECERLVIREGGEMSSFQHVAEMI
jgi:hypothetical protein